MELYSNAAFICERLLATTSAVDQEDVKLMLAESYTGEGRTFKAYEVLKGCTSNQNLYKLALTCIKLKKMAEAERALLGGKSRLEMKLIPNGAAGLYLLGYTQD